MIEPTPAPWIVEEDDPTPWEFAPNDTGMGAHYIIVDEGECIVARCYQQPHDTWSAEANAVLMAASRELLDAAIAAVAQYDTGERGPLGYEDRTPIGLLRAAIQKATGVAS